MSVKIDYIIDPNNPKRRFYWYKEKYRGVQELSKMPECMVSRPTLTQRLSMAINYPERSSFETVEQCMIVKKVKGNKRGPKPMIEIKPANFTFFNSDFLKMMVSMPVNDSEPLIIQGTRYER